MKLKLNGDYIQDMAQLEQCKCHPWGENLVYVDDEEGNGFLVNIATGKARQLSIPG